MNYILGSIPKKISYMVGYGSSYPQQVHQRGASIVSIKTNPAPVGCHDGFTNSFYKNQPNPNVLVGAPVRIPPGFPLKACGNDERVVGNLVSWFSFFVGEQKLKEHFVVNPPHSVSRRGSSFRDPVRSQSTLRSDAARGSPAAP